jgi:hypothetical protein
MERGRRIRVYVTASRRFAGTDLHTGFEGILSVEERRKIRERTRHALAARKARGQWVGGVPFGFRLSPSGRLEEDPAATALRQRALRLRREGRSLHAIRRSPGRAEEHAPAGPPRQLEDAQSPLRSVVAHVGCPTDARQWDTACPRSRSRGA